MELVFTDPCEHGVTVRRNMPRPLRGDCDQLLLEGDAPIDRMNDSDNPYFVLLTKRAPQDRTAGKASPSNFAGSHDIRTLTLSCFAARSEERRVGKACVSTCRSRGERKH